MVGLFTIILIKLELYHPLSDYQNTFSAIAFDLQHDYHAYRLFPADSLSIHPMNRLYLPVKIDNQLANLYLMFIHI